MARISISDINEQDYFSELSDENINFIKGGEIIIGVAIAVFALGVAFGRWLRGKGGG